MDQLQAMLPSHNVSSKHAHSAFTVISQPSGASWTCCHASHDMYLTHSVVSASWTWVCVSPLPFACSCIHQLGIPLDLHMLIPTLSNGFCLYLPHCNSPPTPHLPTGNSSSLRPSFSESECSCYQCFFLLLQLLKKSFPTLPGLWEIPWKHTL